VVSLVEHATGDGRVARGERTRRGLAEALISLVEEGDAQPTARRIAARAGVSLRIVFHHFDDLESILGEAVRIQEQRHWHHIRPVESTLPLDERVARVVRQRDAVFRATAPVRRSAEPRMAGPRTTSLNNRNCRPHQQSRCRSSRHC